MTALLDVKGLTVSFGGNKVVHGINFSIASGEKLALVGESGSGKTVTALSLLGLVQDASVTGQALFQLEPQRSPGSPAGSSAGEAPRAAIDLLRIPAQQLRGLRGQDVAMIFQEPMTALNPLMTIGIQIAEVLELKRGIPRVQSKQLAIKLLEDTGIAEPARRADAYPHQLSGGQRQRAMIAMALACKPKLLLADEPTTALDVTVRGQILDLIDGLQKENGMAVLMITHDLNLVRKFADRVVIMENGHIVEQGPVRDVFASPQHAYTRKLIDSAPVRDVVEVAGGATADPILRAGNLRVIYPVPIPGMRGWFKKGEFVAVKSATFDLLPGQTLGVVGESGSGKSTLALAALGLLPHGGDLTVAGQTWGSGGSVASGGSGGTRVANRSLRKTMQVVFQDPFSSLSPRLTVEEIVGEGLLVHAPTLSKEERRAQVAKALSEVGLAESQFPNLLSRYPHEFSGGQRQRMAIARALIVQPQLLVLDEPTSALDVTIQKQVLQLLQRLQRERGLSYLLITHDVAVIQAMAHYVMVMRDAEIVESGPMAQVFASPVHQYTRTLLAAAG
jgi:microcin C transport system ATP-binding protein